MRLFQGFDLYRRLAMHVARPNNHLSSFLQLARKERVTDDTARRLLDQLEAEVNHPLIVVKDRHLTLTDAGRRLLEVAVKLSAIAENGEPPTDVLTVEADSFVEGLLALALPDFLDLFGSLVQLRICPLSTEMVRANIQSGATSFGVGFFAASEDTVPSAEMLGPKAPWVLLVAKSNQLAAVAEPVDAETLSVNNRVFLTKMGSEWPGMDHFLKSVPPWNRIECASGAAIHLAISGLGVAVVPDIVPEHDALCKRVIDIEPCQLRLWLPKKDMGEVEQALVDQIRQAAEARCKQEAPEGEEDSEEVVEPFLEEPVTATEGVIS